MKENILEVLANAFPISEIMIPLEKIFHARNLEEAMKISNEMNYTMIPLKSKHPKKSNEINKYFDTEKKELIEIKIKEVFSSNTSIFEIIGSFTSEKRHFFVLQDNKICGIIHYSDLNHPVTKLFLFTLIENIERNIYEKINLLPDENFFSKLNSNTKKKAEDFKKKLINKDIDNKWFGAFKFAELLIIARNHNIIKINPDVIESMRIIRNSVAHTDKLLIKDKNKSLEDLQKFKTNSEIIINQLNNHKLKINQKEL